MEAVTYGRRTRVAKLLGERRRVAHSDLEGGTSGLLGLFSASQFSKEEVSKGTYLERYELATGVDDIERRSPHGMVGEDLRQDVLELRILEIMGW